MRIWVDADACPGPIKEILFRASQRTGVQVTLVANQPMRVPECETIDTLLVQGGFDVADEEIVDRVQHGDLVITADIPLAKLAIDKGAWALNPRGALYTEDNISERKAVRDILAGLRDAGHETGGPAAFSPADRAAFANQLDRMLAKYGRS